MKSIKTIGLALAALTCVPFAEAQESSAKLSAYVSIPGAGTGIIALERSDGNGTFYYLQKGTDQLMQAKAASCKMFYIQTPSEMANALREYYSGDHAGARKAFASVKKKYASYAGLPGSPCTLAALHEMTCAARMLDIAAVKTLSADIPGASVLNATEQARVDAARVLAMVNDQPDSLEGIRTAAEETAKKHGRNMDTESYGWMRYAMGRAAAAQVPADQLQATIAEDKVKAASEAVDYFCQAVISMHGSHKEMPADALNRALGLLWAMPGVKEYAGKVTPPLSKDAWNKAPADFRDAVAMARYIKTMFPAEGKDANPLVAQADAYYFNAKKGTKKDK